MLCAVVDQAGAVVQAVGEVYPACSQFVLITVAQADRLTYWADLAIMLDPAGEYFAPLVTAMITSVGIVLGLRTLWDQMRTVTKEA